MNTECIYFLPPEKQTFEMLLLLAKNISKLGVELYPWSISLVTEQLSIEDRIDIACETDFQGEPWVPYLSKGSLVLFAQGKLSAMLNRILPGCMAIPVFPCFKAIYGENQPKYIKDLLKFETDFGTSEIVYVEDSETNKRYNLVDEDFATLVTELENKYKRNFTNEDSVNYKRMANSVVVDKAYDKCLAGKEIAITGKIALPVELVRAYAAKTRGRVRKSWDQISVEVKLLSKKQAWLGGSQGCADMQYIHTMGSFGWHRIKHDVKYILESDLVNDPSFASFARDYFKSSSDGVAKDLEYFMKIAKANSDLIPLFPDEIRHEESFKKKYKIKD